jgi:serine/threonine-protein kinase
MTKIRMIMLIALAALLAGCVGGVVTGSGNLVTQELDFADFDKLDVSQGFHVEVQQGDTFSVVIRVDDNLVDHVQVTKSGSTLRIGLQPSQLYNLRDVTLEADVTMPELTGIDLSGGSHGNLNGFGSVKALDADLSGGSHLNGEADFGDVRFDLSGGSHTTLSGSAENLTLNVSGGSHGKLGNLEVVDADVDANGGSHATVHPSGTLDASASGGSHIK